MASTQLSLQRSNQLFHSAAALDNAVYSRNLAPLFFIVFIVLGDREIVVYVTKCYRLHREDQRFEPVSAHHPQMAGMSITEGLSNNRTCLLATSR